MPITEADLTPTEREIFKTLTSGQRAIYLDLSDEVRHIVGRRAPADACAAAQKKAGVCTPDPRVTAQVGIRQPTDWDSLPLAQKYADRVYKWRLKDARRGDLLMCPGSDVGVIGGLLAALIPKQHYTHMGIIVEDDGIDGTAVRHCTAEDDWMQRKLFRTGTVFGGTPLAVDVPLRGIRSDALQFIWPGTITQTVEVAYKGVRDSVYRSEVWELDGDGNFLSEEDEDGAKQKIVRDKYAVLDPARPGDDRATGGRYRVPALSFGPVVLVGGEIVPPLIVQPCRYKRTDRVAGALGRIADAAVSLRGHYRFFSFTDARVGDLEDGPPTLERESEPFCDMGSYITAPVVKTRGMSCSSFIWQAAQMANLTGVPHILLDGRPAHPEPGSARDDVCSQLSGQLNGRKREAAPPQSASDPVDGLYFYTEANRALAAAALGAGVSGKVTKKIQGFIDDVAGPPFLGALEGGFLGLSVSQLLAINPIGLVAALGLSKVLFDAEIQKIRDMATTLGNQVVDTFRKDDSRLDNDDSDWRNDAKTGNTVSPDDIVNAWASPHDPQNDPIAGLYGSSISVDVLSPMPIEGEWRPSTWEISPDRRGVGARAFRKHAGGTEFLAGALVRIGCAEMTTDLLPDMTALQIISDVPLGRFFAQAAWTDPGTRWKWRSPRRIVRHPGPALAIEVFPPKQSRRNISFRGNYELLNRHLSDEIPWIGTDPWEESAPIRSDPIPMGMDFSGIKPEDDPEFFTWLTQEYGDDLKSLSSTTYIEEHAIESWGLVRIVFELKIDSGGVLTATFRGGLREGTDPFDKTQPNWVVSDTKTVPPKLLSGDPPVVFDVKIERTGPGFPPVRASLHFEIHNDQQPG